MKTQVVERYLDETAGARRRRIVIVPNNAPPIPIGGIPCMPKPHLRPKDRRPESHHSDSDLEITRTRTRRAVRNLKKNAWLMDFRFMRSGRVLNAIESTWSSMD